MSIISSYCDSEPEVVERFMQATKGSELYELRRLAQEVNAAFGTQVIQIGRIMNITSYKPSVRFITADGIQCGSGSVTKDGKKDGGDVYRYYLSFPTISKEKASANSDRDSRDSVNLPALIRTIKKNGEEPTNKKILDALNDGMKYTMRAVSNSVRSNPRLSFDTDLALAVTRFILGVDSQLPNMYISHLQDKFNQFQSEMQSFEAANADYARYARGVTLVCINTVESKPHYLVGDATFNTANDRFELQGGLKRYNSLADSPIVEIATMIKTYFQGTPHYEKDNDLGVLRQDKYFPDIDIAVGYAKHQELWVAIPKNAQ